MKELYYTIIAMNVVKDIVNNVFRKKPCGLLLGFVLFFLLISNSSYASSLCDSTSLKIMEETWHEFRTIHPFGYQTVGLKKSGDTCVFVMSEPAECVKAEELQGLFNEYGGQLIIGRKSFGYDGGLYDAIGCAILDTLEFKVFERHLFKLLYGSDYKPYYTNLNTPYEHVYFSSIKIDYTTFLLSWDDWKQTEKFIIPSRTDHTINKLLLLKMDSSNELYYSRKRGFVLWRINPIEISLADTLFRANARKFALDTDLIVHTFSEHNCLYIVGREREIPVTVLPPLRGETICSIVKNKRREMSVIITPDSMINISDAMDSTCWATPILMDQPIRNTEFGNLLILADFMLKSWSENANVKELFVDYPLPDKFRTQKGVADELGFNPKYLWELSSCCIRTGSLSPLYLTMNDRITEKAREIGNVAHDFFSGLNNTDLVRVCQYANIAQPIIHYSFAWMTKPTFENDSVQWIQSPSMTVSDKPWGYGGVIIQGPLTKGISNVAKKGLKTRPKVRKPVQNKQLPRRVPPTDKALNQRNTHTARQRLLNAKAAQAIDKNNLNSKSSFVLDAAAAKAHNKRLGLQINPREVLINGSLDYPQRGFASEKHNVLPESQQYDSKVDNNEKQDEGKSSSWRERLQKKVFEKSKKINTIETKGNLYMIYGYILKFNDDGEYYSNYAA